MLWGCLLVVAVVALHATLRPLPHPLTQQDIDAAVLHTLDTHVLPSMAQKAYAAVIPSVVHVRGLRHMPPEARPATPAAGRGATHASKGAEHPRAEPGGAEDLYRIGVGSGVVIVDTGVILTNLHVIEGAEPIGVTFSDGME